MLEIKQEKQTRNMNMCKPSGANNKVLPERFWKLVEREEWRVLTSCLPANLLPDPPTLPQSPADFHHGRTQLLWRFWRCLKFWKCEKDGTDRYFKPTSGCTFHFWKPH